MRSGIRSDHLDSLMHHSSSFAELFGLAQKSSVWLIHTSIYTVPYSRLFLLSSVADAGYNKLVCQRKDNTSVDLGLSDGLKSIGNPAETSAERRG